MPRDSRTCALVAGVALLAALFCACREKVRQVGPAGPCMMTVAWVDERGDYQRAKTRCGAVDYDAADHIKIRLEDGTVGFSEKVGAPAGARPGPVGCVTYEGFWPGTTKKAAGPNTCDSAP